MILLTHLLFRLGIALALCVIAYFVLRWKRRKFREELVQRWFVSVMPVLGLRSVRLSDDIGFAGWLRSLGAEGSLIELLSMILWMLVFLGVGYALWPLVKRVSKSV